MNYINEDFLLRIYMDFLHLSTTLLLQFFPRGTDCVCGLGYRNSVHISFFILWFAILISINHQGVNIVFWVSPLKWVILILLLPDQTFPVFLKYVSYICKYVQDLHTLANPRRELNFHCHLWSLLIQGTIAFQPRMGWAGIWITLKGPEVKKNNTIRQKYQSKSNVSFR